MTITFANGVQLPALICYNHHERFLCGMMRPNRDIVLAEGTVTLDTLKELLQDAAALDTIELKTVMPVEVTAEDGTVSVEQQETVEVLKHYVYASDLRDTLNGEIWFTVAEKSALEIENEEAIATIDELLIALEG